MKNISKINFGHEAWVLALFSIVAGAYSSHINAPATTSWVTVETFNEPKCTLDSSSIGGISMESGGCVRGQQVSCGANNVVTVQQFKDQACQTTVTNTTEYTSGVCNTVSSITGFYKTYTCSSTVPTYPIRSLSISTFSSCSSNKQIQLFRWIPSYKCMSIWRGTMPSTSASATASSGSSGSGSSGSGSGSGSTGNSGSVLRAHNFNSKISTVDILDRYFEFLDEINFDQADNQANFEDFEAKATSNRIGSGAGGIQTGSGFGTGTGSSGGSTVTSNAFGIVVCNATYNSWSTFANGMVNSGTGGSVLSTGKYSSGDPFGSNMDIPTTGMTGSGGTATSGSSATGGSGSSNLNGCSIMPNGSGQGKNVQQCYQNQMIAITCTPPYSHA
ncbi:hypothetical protein DFA_01923 [Cavenderia fasciculata]|uniref:Uncharacterized protein n=1 Tax=Cavenderia fasciculata TaxID=261658 RepID=F4PQS6_CACFS|nr:uncharacterized protein DFA_01923 [Cavenderia fasciculata]EGG22034.1 hypothetical protein DFA_01923 [Cavenderia fasciculata]|eukprot:XP_004359885.1 hypothetical protein DFA_01923 [Cavenderia fasciculata]